MASKSWERLQQPLSMPSFFSLEKLHVDSLSLGTDSVQFLNMQNFSLERLIFWCGEVLLFEQQTELAAGSSACFSKLSSSRSTACRFSSGFPKLLSFFQGCLETSWASLFLKSSLHHCFPFSTSSCCWLFPEPHPGFPESSIFPSQSLERVS